MFGSIIANGFTYFIFDVFFYVYILFKKLVGTNNVLLRFYTLLISLLDCDKNMREIH